MRVLCQSELSLTRCVSLPSRGITDIVDPFVRHNHDLKHYAKCSNSMTLVMMLNPIDLELSMQFALKRLFNLSHR